MRTLTSTRRSAVVSVLAFLLVVAGAQAAHACSCFIGDPRDALHRSDGAFIGTLVGRTEVDDQTVDLHVRRGDRGEGHDRHDDRRALRSNGASCGLEVEFGQRIGLLLETDEDGAWIVRPVLADRPDGPAEGGAAAPGAERRRPGAVRGRRQPGREPADGARPQGQDARVRPGRRLRAGRRRLPGRDAGPRGRHVGAPGAAGGAGAALARRGEDDHAGRDATSLDPARGVPERQRRPAARRGTPQGRVLGPPGDRDDRPRRVARPRPRRRDPGRTRLRDRRPGAVRGEPARRTSRAARADPRARAGDHDLAGRLPDRRFRVRAVRGHRADALAGRQHPRRGRSRRRGSRWASTRSARWRG